MEDRIKELEVQVSNIWKEVEALRKAIEQGYFSEPIVTDAEPSDDDARMGFRPL